MTLQKKLLMETLLEHINWLAAKHPSKAATPLARQTQIYARRSLKRWGEKHRRSF